MGRQIQRGDFIQEQKTIGVDSFYIIYARAPPYKLIEIAWLCSLKQHLSKCVLLRVYLYGNNKLVLNSYSIKIIWNSKKSYNNYWQKKLKRGNHKKKKKKKKVWLQLLPTLSAIPLCFSFSSKDVFVSYLLS